MSPLNEAQRRYVLTTFRQIDEIVSEVAETLMRGAEGFASPFSDLVPDATAVQAQALAASVDQLRAVLVDALAGWGIETPPPRTGAVWSARVHLGAIQVVLADLKTSRLRAYGSIDPAAGRAVEEVAAELRSLVSRMQEQLTPGHGFDLEGGEDVAAALPEEPADAGDDDPGSASR